MTREQTSFAYVSSCCLLSLNRRRVVPLYTRVTPVGLRSPNTGSYMCSVWSLLIPNLQYRLTTNAGLRLHALSRPWALSPPLSSWALTYLTTDEVNPAQIGRFTPSSNIPNVRPQINLNRFMSILRKNLCLQHLLVVVEPP